MRVLLLSDIHANFVALETVLEAAEPFDKVWCLGDVVGYGPAPNECCLRLQDLKAETLAGNHDAAVTGALPLDVFNDFAREAIEWTLNQLRPENLAWLSTRESLRLLNEHDLTLVHASPRSPVEEYITSARVARENLPYLSTGVCFFGHTHVPAIYRLAPGESNPRARSPDPGQPILLEPTMLINPGSVGQPRDGDPRAAYAILDSEARTLVPYRIEYDIASTQIAMREAGLPDRLVTRLEFGR